MTHTSLHASAAPAPGRRDHELLSVCHPDEIVNRTGMGVDEKRAILAAWASDAHAVEGAPASRQLDSGAVVPVDDILAALRRLDRLSSRSCPPAAGPPSVPRDHARRRLKPWMVRFRRRDDDDPPPGAPAVGVCVLGELAATCA